jgi:hypothetical protein
MRKCRTANILMIAGIAIILVGQVIGSAAAGWQLKFPFRPMDWAIFGSGAILCCISACLFLLEGKRMKQKQKAFLDELKNTADDLTMPDPEDSIDDLCILYNEEEHRRILDRLAKMPKGKRKLRTVLDQMDEESV